MQNDEHLRNVSKKNSTVYVKNTNSWHAATKLAYLLLWLFYGPAPALFFGVGVQIFSY